MKKILMMLIVLVASSAALCADDVGKVTIDPNTADLRAKQEAEEADSSVDARLAQKVTYEARKKTVHAIVDDLAELTGVKLSAGYNRKDWQVRDRRMNIFAKDVPLSSLMASIARVMKFKWIKNTEVNPPTYRLYMNRKTLLDAETQRLREEEETNRRIAEKREKELSAYIKLGNLSDKDMAKLKQDNPFKYFVAKSGLTNSLGAFFGEVPMAVDAIANGRTLALNGNNLSPSAQSGLLRSMQDIAQLQSRFSRRPVNLPEDLAGNMGQVNIQLNQHMEFVKNTPAASMLLGMMSISYGDKSLDVPFIDPDSNMAKLLGKILVQSEEEGKLVEDVAKGYQGEFMTAMMNDIKTVESGEPVNEHPDDPALEATVKVEADTTKLEDIQAALAKASGLSVVSDNFGDSMGFMAGERKFDDTLKNVLDTITQRNHYNWDLHKSVIELRDRDWYRKRNAQLPEDWIEGWKQTLKDTGTLDIGDLSRIAALEFEQITMNITPDETLTSSNVVGVIMQARDVLRLYAALDDSARAMLFSTGGLNLASVSSNQWPSVEKLISARNAAFLEDPSMLTMRATREQKGKTFTYTFTVDNTGEQTPLKWGFTTPEYKEPKKEQPKKQEPAPASK